MATDVATLGIKVENGDVVKATSSLNSMAVASEKTEKSTQRLTRRMALLEIEARQMDTAMVKSATATGRFASAVGLSEAAVGKLTTAFAAFSAIAVVGLIGRKTIEETEAAQAAMAQLEAAVASTGGVAGRTVAQLDALSIALQKQTTFSDEAVKGAEAMLLTFDKIRGAEFDRATAAVTDLATRMGGDLAGAAVQVGKALQDPATGLTALRRSGVSFSAAQIEVIKKLYDTGRAAEGQRVILAELEHQFGGSAAAARDTLGGALTGLKNAWGDLFEVTRGASQGTVSAINGITAALENSGLSMNKILHDATVDWETMRASIERAKVVLTTPIGPGWIEKVNNQIQRIDFDLSEKIHDLNKPAKVGPSVKPPPITIDVDTKQAKRDLAELQKATDAYYNSLNQHQIDAIKVASTSRAENDQLRDLIAATKDGQDAIERVTIAQAGANAVKELGVGVSDKVAAAVRREAEEHARLAIELGHVQDAQADTAREAERAADAAQRQMEQRAKELHRTVSSTIEGILTDIDQHRNPFVAIFDNLKRGAIKAISDILATKIEGKVAGILGIELPATKQEKAGKDMISASEAQEHSAEGMIRAGQDMIRAAELYTGRKAASATGGVAGITIDGGKESTSAAVQRYLQQFLKIGGAGYGGYQAGYGIGSTTGNKAAGAIGGALSGAATGAAIAGPIGAAVGGLAGLAGGLIGAGDAARAAAERLRKAKEAFDTAFESAKAEVAGDQLASQIAQVHAQYDGLREALKSATPWFNQMVGQLLGLGDYAVTLADVNRLEQERIAQLQQEAAAMARRRTEDYQQRLDEATPGNERAEAIAAFNRKEDREIEDLIRSFGSVIDANEAATLAVAQQAVAAEKVKFATEQNTAAINGLTTSVNTVTGFKLDDLNPYIQEFAQGRPYPGQLQMPTNPFVPPMSPLSPPTLSRNASTGTSTGTVATAPISVTIAAGAIVVNESKTPKQTADEIMNAVLTRVDIERNAGGGLASSRSAALDKMKLRPGAIPWRS